jgi:hypothetical protein
VISQFKTMVQFRIGLRNTTVRAAGDVLFDSSFLEVNLFDSAHIPNVRGLAMDRGDDFRHLPNKIIRKFRIKQADVTFTAPASLSMDSDVMKRGSNFVLNESEFPAECPQNELREIDVLLFDGHKVGVSAVGRLTLALKSRKRFGWLTDVMTIRFLGNVDPDTTNACFHVDSLAFLVVNITLCRSLYFDGHFALAIRMSTKNVSPIKFAGSCCP